MPGYAPRTYTWLERQDYFRAVCGLTGETEPLAGLLLIAAQADWIIPHRHICWVSEPPQVLKTDEFGRLHSASGPALQYGDGFAIYAWKGVEVPARLIERPEQITIADIDRAVDIHVRRCMIERLTPERFIASGAAFRISEDETGVPVGEALGGWRRVGRHRGRQRYARARRRAQALLSPGSAQPADGPLRRRLDLRAHRAAIPRAAHAYVTCAPQRCKRPPHPSPLPKGRGGRLRPSPQR